MHVIRRKPAKFACLCVGSVIIGIIFSEAYVTYQEDNNQFEKKSNIRFLQKTNFEVVYTKNESSIPSEMYKQRMTQVHHVCDDEKINNGDTLHQYLTYSKKHRLVCNIIPKIGSTSLLTVFSILNDSSSENSLTESRKSLHLHSRKMVDMKMFNVKNLANYTVLFPSRDPYTRLYSAFIDKIFIFNSMELALSVATHTGGGQGVHNLTFQMFLDYVLDNPNTKKQMGSHFKAIFIRNTWICALQHFFVIKQETFSTDMEYALKEVDVEQDKSEAIHSALSSRRAEISVAEIVKTVTPRLLYIARKVSDFKKDPTKQEAQIFVLGRLWNSFRIQGFIHAKSRYPVEKYLSSNLSNIEADFVLKTVLDELKHHPLTPSDSTEQRRRLMKVAYDNIRAETVKKIQLVYELDFKAFGYDSNRP